jgi:tRNA threonylcarbamoyladenosine biosynthesis protein TsaB
MKVLSIDTSTMLGGVAVIDRHSGLVAETRLNVKTTHSERLMTVIDRVLAGSELSLSDIDVFAVAIGPGSFTGLRICLSTIKGLSYATGKPVVTVPTLEALAWNFPYSRYPVCGLLDARKGEVYAAVFKWQHGGFERMIDDTSVKPGDLLRQLEGEIIFAGEGVSIYRDKILEIMQGRALIATPEKMVPSPANVAMLGLAKALKGEYTDPSDAVPIYIRKSEAEVKWLARN